MTDISRNFHDRLLEELLDLQARRASTHVDRLVEDRSRWQRATMWIAPAVVAVGLAVTGATLLGTSRPSLAQAALVKRASAALEPSGQILLLNATAYGGGALCIGDESPARCIGPQRSSMPPSTDPSQDVAGYAYKAWIGPSGQSQRTVYNTGDETVTHGETVEVYDRSDNTVTVSHEPGGEWHAGEALPLIRAFSIPQLQALYAQAEAGSPYIRLRGKTTFGSEEVYELEVLEPGTSSLQVFLSATTYLPVKIVDYEHATPTASSSNISSLTTFAARALPTTSANQAELGLAAHPGASRVSFAGGESTHGLMFASPAD